MLNLNLPDATVGHAILETAGSEILITPAISAKRNLANSP